MLKTQFQKARYTIKSQFYCYTETVLFKKQNYVDMSHGPVGTTELILYTVATALSIKIFSMRHLMIIIISKNGCEPSWMVPNYSLFRVFTVITLPYYIQARVRNREESI